MVVVLLILFCLLFGILIYTLYSKISDIEERLFSTQKYIMEIDEKIENLDLKKFFLFQTNDYGVSTDSYANKKKSRKKSKDGESNVIETVKVNNKELKINGVSNNAEIVKIEGVSNSAEPK